MEHHKNCGCNNKEPVMYVTFENEDKEVACDVLGIFELEEMEYIALVPRDTEDDVLLYRFKEEEENLTLDEIKTDEEYDKVASEFKKLFFPGNNNNDNDTKE